jgi:hypothetical protein
MNFDGSGQLQIYQVCILLSLLVNARTMFVLTVELRCFEFRVGSSRRSNVRCFEVDVWNTKLVQTLIPCKS